MFSKIKIDVARNIIQKNFYLAVIISRYIYYLITVEDINIVCL